jgi:acetyl esterase/lipase
VVTETRERRVAYGRELEQHAGLRLPATGVFGDGPYAVEVLIHGGCWSADFDRGHVEPLARGLAEAGFAVWTLEYRRLGQPGGGWPGTFADVGDGIEALRGVAGVSALDLNRVVLAGHSAGGQLALWYAAAPRRSLDGPLRRAEPLAVRGVVALAPVTDLRDGNTACGGAGLDLLGGLVAAAGREAQASPLLLPPLGIPQRLIHGVEDRHVPLSHSRRYLEAARAAGDAVELEEIPGANHFDVITPGSLAWPAVLKAVKELAE